MKRSLKLFEYRTTLFVTLGLLMYFLWMDVALYYRIQHLPSPAPPVPSSKSSDTIGIRAFLDHRGMPSGKGAVSQGMAGSDLLVTSSTNGTWLLASQQSSEAQRETSSSLFFSPFTGLSVKMMMLDQANNYIHTPLAQIFNRVTHFATVFYFITPNMISFAGFLSACLAARLVMKDSLAFHRLAVAAFCLRTWFDALDGLVARERVHVAAFLSLRNTTGYIVDGVADACGFSVFLIGCFIYLRRKLTTNKQYLPFSKRAIDSAGVMHPPQSAYDVAKVIGCFACQLTVSCIFWDRYISEYHDILEVPSPSIDPLKQTAVMRSHLMWVIMWFWRISNAHSLMHFLLWFIFVNRMWDFLVFVRWIGLVELLSLIVLSETHLQSVKRYLM